MTAAGHTSDLRSLLVPAGYHTGGADALTFFLEKAPLRMMQENQRIFQIKGFP